MGCRSNLHLERLVFKGRGKPEYLEKSLSDSGKGENQQQTQLMYYGINAGVQTWATLVAGTTFTPQQKPFFSFSVPHLVHEGGSCRDTNSHVCPLTFLLAKEKANIKMQQTKTVPLKMDTKQMRRSQMPSND